MSHSNVPLISNLFQQTDHFPFADLHFWNDPKCQLQAIIAIHNTTAGPALGGCRMFPYASTENALIDVLNLAMGMGYKAAINQLPFGGGKSVIIQPGLIKNRQALMESFGRFVDSLGGRYITAMDVGTETNDMDNISHFTQHVTCTSEQRKGTGDPSPYTAKGVFRGIQAATKFLFHTKQLSGIHVVVQGLGHVGYELLQLLHDAGARLTVSDIDKTTVKHCIDEFSADSVAPEKVYEVECDIFSPCAMGQILNPETIQQLKTRAIAGAANNQLLDKQQGEALRKKHILYTPDYIINSGGLLQIAYSDNQQLNNKIDALYNTLLGIFYEAEAQHKATNMIADEMAEHLLEKQVMIETKQKKIEMVPEPIERLQA